MDVLGVIKRFVDAIFQPPITFIELSIEKLQGIRMITSQGLNIGQYFSVFGDLPTHFQLVVSSILISCVLLGSLLIFRTVTRIYFAVKEGVKWW